MANGLLIHHLLALYSLGLIRGY